MGEGISIHSSIIYIFSLFYEFLSTFLTEYWLRYKPETVEPLKKTIEGLKQVKVEKTKKYIRNA